MPILRHLRKAKNRTVGWPLQAATLPGNYSLTAPVSPET